MKTHRREQIVQWLVRGRQRLTDNPDEPALALMEILDIPELEEADLARLAYLLWTGKHGCHRNDVTGVFELFEEWLDEQEIEEDA
jgi:hypothetical protein